MKFLTIVLISLLASQVSAQYYPEPEFAVYGSPASSADKIAINSLLSNFQDAWAEGDAARVAAAHGPTAEWINAFGRTFRGAEALESFLRDDLFPNYPLATSREEMNNFKETSRRYIGEDAVVVQAMTNSFRGSAVAGNERRIFFTLVLGKSQGNWSILHQTITDVRPRRNQ